LTEARNFAQDGFFAHGFFVPAFDYPNLSADPSGVHSDSFPTSSIFVGLLFSLFGMKLWAARLLHIFFSLGGIFFFYLIMKRLYQRDDLALVGALLFAINPLSVFFGRQVQLIGPALFFCLMGIYYYLSWIKKPSISYTFLFSIPLFLGIITKYTYVLFLVPLVVVFPWKTFLWKKHFKLFIFLGIIGLCFGSIVYTLSIQSGTLSSEVSTIKNIVVFDDDFQKIMKSYVADNFSIRGFWIFLAGFVLFLCTFKKKQNQGNWFFLSYFLIALPWVVLLSFKLKGHNYHQFPLIPLFVFFVAYFFLFISNSLTKLIIKNNKWFSVGLSFILIFVILFSPSVEAKNRMFGTQFFGLDIAGDYVANHRVPGDRAMHSGHQAYGFLWHANIKGTKGIPLEQEKMIFAENNLNASWIFLYNWDFGAVIDNPAIWPYINEHYGVAQIGFLRGPDQSIQPYYFLLRKNGHIKYDDINSLFNTLPIQKKQYELPNQKVDFYYINFES